MLWSRRRNGARTPGKGKKSVRVAARQTVESLETRRLFAYAMTQVAIDSADPQYTMAANANYVLVGQPSYAGFEGQVAVVDVSTGQALAPISNPNTALYDQFGANVALLGGGRIAIGSLDMSTGEGTVFIYDSISDSSPLPIQGDSGNQSFGMRLEALGSNSVLVSALTQSTGDTSGAVYVYDAATGTRTATFTSGLAGDTDSDTDVDAFDDGVANDQFGRSLAVEGTSILVGGQNGPGMAYVAEINTVTGEIATTFDGNGNAAFGETLDFAANNTVMISDSANQAIYRYDRSSPAAPTETYTVAGSFNFGPFFDVSGDTLIAGDPLANDGMSIYGEAYVFDLATGPSSHETLTDGGTNPSSLHSFGQLVRAIDGETFAVLDVPIGTTTESSFVYLFKPEAAATPPTADAGADQSVVRQQDVTLTGSGSSTSATIVSYEWDLNFDGPTFDVDATGSSVSTAFATDGSFTVALRVTDSNGLTAIDTTTVTVSAAGLQGGNLFVGGSSGGDVISIDKDTGSGSNVIINGALIGTFDVTGNVIVFAGGGNDVVDSKQSNTAGAIVYGGEGNDTITGGGGNDFLFGQGGDDIITARHGDDVAVGGDGNDTLTGGIGRDILFGGLGTDSLVGNTDDDILVAGSTSHDGDLAALENIRSIWQSAGDYATRVNTLSNGLLSDSNVFEDSAIDTVKGGSGQDWFLINEDGPFADVLRDLKSSETTADITA